MIFLKNKPETAKFCDHLTFSLIAHAAKIVERILCRRIEGVLGELQFGFIESKGTRFAIGMMRIISERTLDTDEELRLCFLEYQNKFDVVNWNRLMQVLNVNGIDLLK